MGCAEHSLFGTDDRPSTGCIATGIAQVMRYHEYHYRYNWSVMLPRITHESWYSSTLEVARLMRDIGMAVHMNCDCSGSGSTLPLARSALVVTFGYSQSKNYLDHFDRPTIVNDLENGRPVVLGGISWITGMGHAWACDGYTVTHYRYIHNPGSIYEYTTEGDGPWFMHTNWGWNGREDSWYESFAHAMKKGEIVVSLAFASTRLVQYGLQDKHPPGLLK